MKRYLSLLLTVIMLVSCFALPTYAAGKDVAGVGATTAIKTQNEAVEWLKSQNNATYDFNGKNGTQCVEFVKAYVNWLMTGDPWEDVWNRPTLDGGDIWKNSLWEELGWTVHKNTADFMPLPGDIFSAGLSLYTHTGVVISSNLNTAIIADANARNKEWSDGDPVYVHEITWRSASTDSAYGATYYIRPNFKTSHITHSYDTYVYYWASHPHYKCYKCSCGEIKENRDEPTYIDSCAQCRVGKTTVSSDKDVYYTGENVKLSWTAASNATHYNFYIMKKNSSGEYKEQIDWIREYKQTSYTIEGLSAGDYMIRMYSYDSKHWEPDGSDWCHEMADQIYFSVKENEQNIETIELSLERGDNFIPVSWTEVPGAVKYEFSAVDNRGNIKSIETAETTIEWDPDESGFFYESIRVQVKAFDSKGTLVGKSDEQWYEISMAHGDWWGDCGDTDMDGKVTVKDATLIQKYLAGMVELSAPILLAANVNKDSSVNIKDATVIQKFIAGIEVESNIGQGLFWYCTMYFPVKLERVESDWVLASELPDGAEIVDEKWTYDLATRTTSGSSTAPTGYSQYKDPTWEWGSYGDWSEWSKTVYTESDSRQVESQYYAATTKTVWKYNRDVNSAGTLSTYSLGYYGNCQYITLDYKLSSMGTVDGRTRYGSYDGGYGSYLKNYWWNESQASEVVTPAYYMYRYRDRSKVYTYYYQMIESKESQTEIVPSDTITNVQKWVKYVVY